MSSRDIAAGDAPMVQVVAPDGTASGAVEVGLSDEDLRELLRQMIRARRLDRECMALQRQGELTVYPPFEGQEAAQVGSAFALEPQDFVFPSFRELAAAIVRGVDAVEYLQYHRGTWHGGPYDPIANRFAPICVPVATQIVHAVGWALGAKLDGSRACALAYFGDGSASEGDFHEAANMAASTGRRRSCSARTTGGPSPCRSPSRRPRRSRAARPATASPASGSTATTCSPCTR